MGGWINVDLEYYVENFGGKKIPEDSFPEKIREAESIVNFITFGRIHGYVLSPEDLECAKMAICAVADSIWENKKRDGVVSENTDGYSVTYSQESGYKEAAADAARAYLIDTTLLERRVNWKYDYKR